MAALTGREPVRVDSDGRPLVLHVMFRFDTGGLENGVVNLINCMDAGAYRHAVLALTEVTGFRHRIKREDVEFIALGKSPGHTLWQYPRLLMLFLRLKPAIVHTRNLGALEVVIPAWAARVRARVHGEHGRDVGDLTGSNRKHQWLRRLYRPFVSHYFALSRDLANYLVKKVHVPVGRLTQVYNGVDSDRFRPPEAAVASIDDCPFDPAAHWIIGTVGRMQAVKDQVTLARAFVRALSLAPELRQTLRLVLIGDGPLRSECAAVLESAGLADAAWLPGERSDIPSVLRGLHCFVLPSLAEGISNTILEAMASAVPVIATDVGGNADLVVHGQTGEIVPAGDPEQLAASILRLARTPDIARQMGQRGRKVAIAKFSMKAMVSTYQARYDALLGIRTVAPELSNLAGLSTCAE